MDDRSRLLTFLSGFFRGHSLRDDEDMFALGFVNSLFAMQLVAFIEKEFNMTLESEDLEIDNFRSVGAILAFIEKKRRPATA